MITQPFVDYIEQKSGIYLDSKYEFKLSDAVTRRMTAVSKENERDYLELVRQNRKEFNNLINLITVNETYFQREPDHFKILSEKIAPKLLGKTSRPLRVLSAGCSTGEEIYSIAMTLREKFGLLAQKRFEFLAFDIDSKALETAEKGVYGRSSFRAISPELLKRYFEDFGPQTKRIIPELRSNTRFIHNNIMSPTYPSELSHVDVIFYRNTSIYFKPTVQKIIFQKLTGLLNDPGYLFLSSTETFAHDFGILPLAELDNNFFFSSDPSMRKKNAETKKKETEKFQLDLKPLEPPLEKPGGPKDIFRRVCELIESDKYYEALRMISEADVDDEGLKSDLSIARAKISLDLGQYDKARELCLKVAEKNQWLLWPCLLLGCLAMLTGDEAEQLEKFKKAVYILPTCWLAHYGLLKCHIMKSDEKNAFKETKIATRLLEKDASDWFCSHFAPKFINKESILSECRGILKRYESSRKSIHLNMK